MKINNKIKNLVFNNESGNPPKLKKSFRALILWFLILLFLEIFVFNFNSYHLLFGSYEEKVLSLEDATLTNLTYENGAATTVKGKEVISIEFTDIDTSVGTLYLDLVCPENLPEITVSIDANDATNANYRVGVAEITVIRGDERSKTIPLHLSGEVSKIRLKFDSDIKQATIVKNVSVNKPISFHFSILRFSLLYIIIILTYFFLYSPKMKKTYNESSRSCFGKVIIITSFFLVAAVLFAALNRTDSGGSLKEDFTSTEGNQITKELVDAFEKGQVKLDFDPPVELQNLENPYDLSQRNNSGISYAWDHVYFEGNYYSYYGIAPVVLLFLPYHLITGFYFPCIWAVMLFGMVGILFLSKLYFVIIKKWFGNLQINYVLMGLIILQLSSGIWMSISRAAFYEIAISSGFAFTLVGAYFLISSNIIGEGKISKIRLALATSFLAIAVLCRPTLAVYCIAALAFLYYGFKKQRNTEKNSRKNTIKYLLSALLPFVIFGGVQIAYNWARFGSPIDFGIQYSLTINDFTNSEYHSQFVLMIAYAFLFAAPYLQPQFPFVYSSFQDFGTNGYNYIDDKHVSGIAIGIFFRALPMFGYFLSKKAYCLLDKSIRKKALILLGLPCILAPLTIIFSVWESGYAVRYNADISWQMLIGAIIILFTLLLYTKNMAVHRIATMAFVVSTILCFVVNFGQYYNFVIARYISDDLTPTFYALERLIEFWR